MIDLSSLDSFYVGLEKGVSERLRQSKLLSDAEIDDLRLFDTQVGRDFPEEKGKGLLFYGRATNGWSFYGDEHEPINVVLTKYRKRPFFKLLYWVGWNYYDDNYCNTIAWSNIYKMAPNRGNPSDFLRATQEDYVKTIIEREIELLSPGVIVLVTGNTVGRSWSKPFFDAFHNLREIDKRIWGKEEENTTTLYSDGTINVILTNRPEYRPIGAQCDSITTLIEDHHLDRFL